MNSGGERLYRVAADNIPHMGGERLKRRENTFILRELLVPVDLTYRLIELGYEPHPETL